MTTVKTKDGYVPFSVALERARNEAMASRRADPKHMTTKELEQRKKAIQHYMTLRKIAKQMDMTSCSWHCAAFIRHPVI